MKVYHVQQGSIEWAELRRGRPTASEFGKIVTPTGKISEQARKYAHLLVAEELLGRSLISLDELEWVARGKELEPDAATLYEFEKDVDTQPIGFITTDDGLIGASPDRLIGNGGILEIKCPAPQTHVGYMIDGFNNLYKPQVQGQLLVSEHEWADWMSYCPLLQPVVERVYRDEPYIKLLREALDKFCAMKAAMLETARARGLYAESKRPRPEREHGPSLDEMIRLNKTAMRLLAP